MMGFLTLKASFLGLLGEKMEERRFAVSVVLQLQQQQKQQRAAASAAVSASWALSGVKQLKK